MEIKRALPKTVSSKGNAANVDLKDVYNVFRLHGYMYAIDAATSSPPLLFSETCFYMDDVIFRYFNLV